MSVSESDLIRRYFTDLTPASAAAPADTVTGQITLGIGDDCALLVPPPGMQLAVSMDTLVSDRHFLADTDPRALGHKALAVNLSDLAAMGASPAWAMLSLTLPGVDEAWLAGFCAGFAALAGDTGIRLVGGDLVRGPLSISVQVTGFLDPDTALTRAGARCGDKIFVSGHLGDAGLALLALTDGYAAEGLESSMEKLLRPCPRLELGNALRGIASAAIDISDGLLADLGRLCERSGTSARLSLAKIPVSTQVRTFIDDGGDWQLALSAGDDYELCFTVAPERLLALQALKNRLSLPLTCVGEMVEGEVGIVLHDGQGSTVTVESAGFDHFR